MVPHRVLLKQFSVGQSCIHRCFLSKAFPWEILHFLPSVQEVIAKVFRIYPGPDRWDRYNLYILGFGRHYGMFFFFRIIGLRRVIKFLYISKKKHPIMPSIFCLGESKNKATTHFASTLICSPQISSSHWNLHICLGDNATV